VGKWHLKEMPAGFDYCNVLRGQGRYNNPILFESKNDGKETRRTYKGHSTDVITDQALGWLKTKESEKKQPFCLMVHYKAVHEPFKSARRFRTLFQNEDLPEPEDLLWPESPQGKNSEELWELYDLKTDPHERFNVYGKPENEDVIKELKGTLKSLQAEFKDTPNAEEVRINSGAIRPKRASRDACSTLGQQEFPS